jgi:thiamine-monophosphate kinase
MLSSMRKIVANPVQQLARNPETGELALIERIRKRCASNNLAARHLRLGIGDDCAIVTPPRGHELLVTTDLCLEGRHFRRDWHSPQSIGHRTLARGLSDLAAMGAKPLAAFLSLALPKNVANDAAWLDGFLDGLLSLAKLHNIPLAGGDTSESPTDHILADIVLLGSAPAGRALRRSGAKPGDLLYVTGALGGAAAELSNFLTRPKSRSSQPKAAHFAAGAERPLYFSGGRDHPHFYPQPRLAVGQALLRRRLATACIDTSDGLSTDLAHLCSASHVAAELDAAVLPAHPLTDGLGDAAQIAAVLHGGEDYELLFTVPPSTKLPRSIAGIPITRIGRILKQQKNKPQMTILSDGTRFELQPQGWEHLR